MVRREKTTSKTSRKHLKSSKKWALFNRPIKSISKPLVLALFNLASRKTTRAQISKEQIDDFVPKVPLVVGLRSGHPRVTNVVAWDSKQWGRSDRRSMERCGWLRSSCDVFWNCFRNPGMADRHWEQVSNLIDKPVNPTMEVRGWGL